MNRIYPLIPGPELQGYIESAATLDPNPDIFSGALYVDVPRPRLGFMPPLIDGLWFKEAFAWIYPDGGRVAGHFDRDADIWSLSLPILIGSPTGLIIRGNHYPTIPGQGILMNGGREFHSRPTFRNRHIHLMLSYREFST